MTVGPTTGAFEPIERSWAASPVAAWVVRSIVFVVPIAAGWLAVHSVGAFFLQPEGWVGVVFWAVQAVLTAFASATIVDRAAQRVLPLATLMGMSLTFPDQAPSRFSMALRTGTVRQLRARLDDVQTRGLGNDAQTAAVRAVEMVTMLGQHERLTRGHTERVRAHAEVIAVELGLSDEDRQMLAWGVLLHDIGKLTVPPEILNKDGRPTAEEWAILKRHPEEGGKIVEPLRLWLGDWANATTEHHERWDGDGYPEGLRGPQISLAGRITAVADAYDVITSRRSYKAPMSVKAARQELVDSANAQFDPAVVRAFLQASVRRGKRRVGLLSWLPELPGLATISHTIAATPAVAAVAVVAAAATLTGIGATDIKSPSPLALSESAPLFDASSGSAAPVTPPDTHGHSTVLDTSSTSHAPATSGATGGTVSTSATTEADSNDNPTTTIASPTPASSITATSPSTAVATTTTLPADTTTSTTVSTGPYIGYLTNPGTGATSSDPELALTSGPVDTGSLPNFDTDRDSEPGLLIAKDGAGLATSDPTKFQSWTWVAPASTNLSGPAILTIYVGAKDLTSGETIGITGAVDMCTPTCTQIGAGNWTTTSQSSVFSVATVSLGNISETLAPGEWLRIRVVAPDTLTDTDIFIAYDTTAHPSRLQIG